MPKRGGISRIPPEILTEIFVHCLPEPGGSTPRNAQPVLLSSVCVLWRALVLATPALWASLEISCRMGAPRPSLPDIRTRLQRSGTHPLSFTLSDGGSSEQLNSFNTPTILTAVTVARKRWRNADITVYKITQETLDLIMLGDAPLLQSIRCYVRFPQERLPIPLHMLDHCPHLESFYWSNRGAPLLLPLKNTQLTSLSLQAKLSVSECITLLRLSPRLSSAEFHYLRSSDPFPAPRFTHPMLCTLTAAGMHSDTLLDALTLPALLALDLMIRDAEWDTRLTAFLARSNPTLRRLSLHITHLQVAEPALLHILTLVPHLRSLKLSSSRPIYPPLTATFIRALHPPPPPGAPLCPHLQRLNLSRIEDCPDGLCTAMLRARWGAQAHTAGVACLEQVSLEVEGGMHRRDLENMMELRAGGMDGTLFWRMR